MSFSFKIEGLTEVVNYLTTTLPKLHNEAALYAVQGAMVPHLPEYVRLLQTLPVKHVLKQAQHRQRPATPLHLKNGIYQRSRHIWDDIITKAAVYRDQGGAYGRTGAREDEQTPLDRFIESGSRGAIRYWTSLPNRSTGIMPTYRLALNIYMNHRAAVDARKMALYEEKLLQLRRSAGERV